MRVAHFHIQTGKSLERPGYPVAQSRQPIDCVPLADFQR
jgi:hypothetical protein